MLNVYISVLPDSGRWGYINSFIVYIEGNIQTETEIVTKFGRDIMLNSEHISFQDNYSYCKNFGQLLAIQQIKKDIRERFEGEEINFIVEPCFYMVVSCYGKKAPHLFLGTMHK